MLLSTHRDGFSGMPDESFNQDLRFQLQRRQVHRILSSKQTGVAQCAAQVFGVWEHRHNGSCPPPPVQPSLLVPSPPPAGHFR